MIQTGYNSLPKTQRNFLWCIGRDGERELLKDRSQMVVFSLITAFGTLLRYSMEQRGPTITSCRGFLIYHPCTRSAHAFSTASPWNSQERSCHSHPVPSMLCTLWSPTTHPAPACAHLRALQLLWKMWAGLWEDPKSVGGREALPTPATWDTTWCHCDGSAALL